MPGRPFGYSFNAYNEMIGAGKLTVIPATYFSLTPSFEASAEFVIGYGITPAFDLFADIVTFTYAPELRCSQVWIMPRFDLGWNNIAALQIMFENEVPGFSVSIAPQYHFFYENDIVFIEFNAIVTVPVSAPADTVVEAIVAPGWKVSKNALHLFLELDPSYTFGSRFEVTLLPGMCICFARNTHQICVGIPFSDITSGTLNMGVSIWYAGTFRL